VVVVVVVVVGHTGSCERGREGRRRGLRAS
jgi:hypothetical protein